MFGEFLRFGGNPRGEPQFFSKNDGVVFRDLPRLPKRMQDRMGIIFAETIVIPNGMCYTVSILNFPGKRGPFMQYKDADIELHHTLTESPDEGMFPLHAHNRYEIYCFLAGQGYYTVEGHDYPLTPGCILVMRDGETHKLHISPDRPYERMALHFAPHLVDPAQREVLLAPFRARPLGQRNMLLPSDELSRVIDMLRRITDGSLPPEADRPRILAYLPAILHELSRAALVGSQSGDESSTVPLVGQIIDYINRAPAEVESMEALEARFGFSRSYLNRTFRRSTGVSIWDYVILKRLTEARKAIRRGTPAVPAAKAVGYTDYSSFYRQYKKRFGITPEEEKRSAPKDIRK